MTTEAQEVPVPVPPPPRMAAQKAETSTGSAPANLLKPAAPTPQPPVERTLTAADILEEGRPYTSGDLLDLLSIPESTTSEAIRINQMPDGSNIHRQNAGDGYFGRDLLRWIQGAKVRYAITDNARTLWAYRQRKLRPEAPPPPKANIADQAFAKIAGYEISEAESNQAYLRRAATEYVAILCRFDNPLAGDVDRMDVCIQSLGLERKQIDADREIVCEATRLHDLHCRRAQIAAELADARENIKAMEERHRTEVIEAYKRKDIASMWSNQIINVAFDLERMKRQRPILFDDSNPPRILGAAAVSPISG